MVRQACCILPLLRKLFMPLLQARSGNCQWNTPAVLSDKTEEDKKTDKTVCPQREREVNECMKENG